jgi:hypothetical protein
MPKMDSEKKRWTESAIQSFLESIQEATGKKLNPTGFFFIQPKHMMFEIIKFYLLNWILMELRPLPKYGLNHIDHIGGSILE